MGNFKENNYEKIVELFKLFGEQERDYSIFYANDYPIPYKGLTIYPVQVDLYMYFHSLVECLLLPHMTSGDINAISMSYFDYLVYLAKEKESPQYISQLFYLLQIVLRIPGKDEKGNLNIDIIPDGKKSILRIFNETYNSQDFDRIRKIICDQNALEMPDEETHPDIVKAIKEVEEYKRKQANVKMCSFEDQINIVVAKSSYRRDECIKMTIRSFTRLLERVDKIMHYEIYTLLSPNLTKEGQKNITHYMAAEKTRKERYEENRTEQNEINKKLQV
ncbi:MAG: hypothetical protein IKI95_01530 [Clostridia bacterium]|nr:hypothetical protein [Clostridia bacterium]